MRNWQVAREMFDRASSRLEYVVIETERRHHAYDYVKELQHDLFDGVITVSGDGLLHEVVNGFLQRDDWDMIKDHITIGGIPGGTGNGLIKSLLAEQNEIFGIQEAAWLIIRGDRKSIDLTKLTLEFEPHPVYSFLSVAWSVIADIDLNSEVCRCLGAFRFDVWGAYRVFNLMHARGNVEINGKQVHHRQDLDGGEVTSKFENQDFLYFYALNMPFAAAKLRASPLARPQDGFNDIVTSRR